jgi:hypothetical protein
MGRGLATVSALLGAITLFATGAGETSAASSYRLCDNPRTHYLVTAVRSGAGCKTARRVAKVYFRRLYGDNGEPSGDYNNVLGWRCGEPRNGLYYGLYGARAKCHNGSARIRFDYRGE